MNKKRSDYYICKKCLELSGIPDNENDVIYIKMKCQNCNCDNQDCVFVPVEIWNSKHS